MESDQEERPEFPQQRRVYLITYSQADLDIFPYCLAFSEAVVDAFGEANVKEWACCRETHQEGGEHYHMAISLKSSRRWGPVKKAFMKNYNVSLHFSVKTCGYVAAYRYVCKDKEITEVLHSPGHTNMERISSPKTKNAMRKWSDVSTKKRKSTTSPAPDVSTKKPKPTRLSNVDVSNLLVKEGIKCENKLCRLAMRRASNGEPDLQAFVLNRTPKALADLITMTWKLQNSENTVDDVRETKTRMQILHDCLESDCIEGCNKEWLRCAKEILGFNSVNVYDFACAIRTALKQGRKKHRNILIVGDTDCGKSFLLDPLELIYKCFMNPAKAKYAWSGLDECEVAFLNDFRWNSEIIAWNDFLLLLEGATVHLPRPKNHFATDLLIHRSNSIPIFSTSIGPFEFVRNGMKDQKETDMMASRWRLFSFTHTIKNPNRDLEPCPRCFAELIMYGADAED